MTSLRLAQSYSATSTFHLQSQPWRLNLNTNTNTNTNTRFNLKQRTSKISISSRRRTVPIIRAASKIPERDRPIPFGKYKGKMLGTMPLSYLKWIVANVDDWSKIAKVVIDDPIYQDRIEWDVYESMVDELIAEKFGWDMEDRKGWSMVKRELLGTSFSGRIPRMADREKRLEMERAERAEMERKIAERKAARPFVGGERRRERLERQRAKREAVMKKKPEVIIRAAAVAGEEEEEKRKLRSRRFLGKYGVALAPRSDEEYDDVVVDDDDDDKDRTARMFPGRGSLVKRAFEGK